MLSLQTAPRGLKFRRDTQERSECARAGDSSPRRARSARLALTITFFAQNTKTPTHLNNPGVKEISTVVPP